MQPQPKRRKYSLRTASVHLGNADDTMAQLINHIGSTRVRSEADLSVYQSLARAICYQMLSTRSAAAIYSRLLDVCGNRVTPETVEGVGERALRDIGFSRAKVVSIMDLTGRVQSGDIPDDVKLMKMSDDELVDCLTRVKGIGRWSVEMLMIFNLGRADVFPATDLGVRKGHMLAYGLDEMLPATELLRLSDIWKPYRTAAAWYLWRATDSVDWNKVKGENHTQPQRG